MPSRRCVFLEHEQAEKTKARANHEIATDANTADLHDSGDAISDAKYEYGDKISESLMQVDNAMIFGYEYGMAAPDSEGNRSRSSSPKGAVPSRSSMKSTSRRHASNSQTRGGGADFQVDLPGDSESARRRQSISFNEGVNVFIVHPITSLTDKPESLWLQDEEISYIQQQITSLVKDKTRYRDTHDCRDSSVQSGSNDGECCTRGLERMLQPERTKIKRCQAWDTVFNEQYLQRQDGEFDDESIAVMYGHATRRSQREAERRGSKDAEEIESYLRSTRRMCGRMSR
jgi:hypothetical protein